MVRAGYGGTIALPVWVDDLRYALNGVASKGLSAPAGVVSRDGEYYLKEQQSTNPALPLDNRSSRPLNSNEQDGATAAQNPTGSADNTGAGDEPAAPAAPSGGSQKGQLDSLF